MVSFALAHYLATNLHLNILFLLGIIFLSYLLLAMMYHYILFQIFHKLSSLFFASIYGIQERSQNISHLR